MHHGPASLVLLGALALGGCARAKPPAAEPGGEREGKLAFSQEAGCQNDGSVEFCVAKDDAALRAEVERLAPSAAPAAGGAGRAGCDTARETLYFYPTPGEDPAVCTAPAGALSERAWQELRALAALPQIRAIVATRYE